MKRIISLAISLVFVAAVHAETEFPRGTFEIADLEKAKSLATTEKKDIAFIYTDKNSTCPLCQGAAAAYIDAVKSKTVIVYLDAKGTNQWWASLPKSVRDALTPGKFIPKIVVTDPTVSKVSGSLTYETYKEDDRKAIRGLKKAMKAE